MDVFGKNWEDHPDKVAAHWRASVHPDDLVLIAGDISWAMTLEQIAPDLAWLEALPGTKVMIRGNHDYWWSSLKKVSQILPPSIHVIQHNSFCWKDFCIGGTRLWDSHEYDFERYIRALPAETLSCVPLLVEPNADDPQQEQIFLRELARLEMSLRSMPRSSATRIVMTHYPPIGVELHDSRVSALLEDYDIKACVFGHIHSVMHDFDPLFGTKGGVAYHFVAADYLDFAPLKIVD